MNKQVGFFIFLLGVIFLSYVVFAAGGETSFQTDALTFGKPSAADKTLTFRKGVSANPAIKWNNTASQLQFSNDGTTYVPFGTSTDSSKDMQNIGFTTSVGSNALTVAVKTKAGTDPSSSDISYVGFRNATSTNGTYSIVQITGALSMTVSVGSTLGMSSGVEGYVYVYLINNSGTAELAVSSNLYDDGSIVSTTAEGGAGGADSSTAIYSTTARSNVPLRLLGRIEISEASAGTWASNATELSVAPFFNYRYPIKYQEKLLASNVTASGAISSLTFNNLQVGRYYRVKLHCSMSISASQSIFGMTIVHNGVTRSLCRGQSAGPGGESFNWANDIEAHFIAAATTVTFNKTSAAGTTLGTGAYDGTWARIEEIPANLYNATTDFN